MTSRLTPFFVVSWVIADKAIFSFPVCQVVSLSVKSMYEMAGTSTWSPPLSTSKYRGGISLSPLGETSTAHRREPKPGNERFEATKGTPNRYILVQIVAAELKIVFPCVLCEAGAVDWTGQVELSRYQGCQKAT